MPEKGNIHRVTLPELHLEQILEIVEQLEMVAKPFEDIAEFKKQYASFLSRFCKFLEASMRSDIGCLYKYISADFCKDSKIEECLTRLWKSYSLYRKLCCRR